MAVPAHGSLESFLAVLDTANTRCRLPALACRRLRWLCCICEDPSTSMPGFACRILLSCMCLVQPSMPLLCCPAGLFGQQQQQQQATGTRTVPYQTTSLTDASKPTERQNFKTICAMPQYSSKSVEELRWEDYQVNRGQIVGSDLIWQWPWLLQLC